jgi:hypothetical protein
MNALSHLAMKLGRGGASRYWDTAPFLARRDPLDIAVLLGGARFRDPGWTRLVPQVTGRQDGVNDGTDDCRVFSCRERHTVRALVGATAFHRRVEGKDGVTNP